METKYNISGLSSNLLTRAAERAFRDMQNNWNFSRIRVKRDRQYRSFFRMAHLKAEAEENSICPYVPKEQLKDMPKNTFVILDGTGRDFYGNFMSAYSGHAGTQEQCLAFVEKYYDKHANWEFLPSVISLEDFLNMKAR